MGRNKIIGERVRFYRKMKDMSMADLSSMLVSDLGLQQLARYETDKSRWPADLICEVAEVLEVDVKLLLGLDGMDKPLTTEEIDAERYKNAILSLPEKSRKMVFNMVDGLAGQ